MSHPPAPRVPAARPQTKVFRALSCHSTLRPCESLGPRTFKGIGLHWLHFHVCDSIGQCIIFTFCIRALASPSKYANNCRKHILAAIFTDGLHPLQYSTKTGRNSLFGSDQALEDSVVFPSVHFFWYINSILRVQTAYKATLFCKRRGLPQAGTFRFVTS